MASPQKIADGLAQRAQAILDDEHNYSQKEIMASAFNDFKALGNMAGIMSVMTSGKLSSQQVDLAKRLATKVIAVLSHYEE